MKILIFRSGAYGDNIILTPVLRHLHSQGHELYVQTSARGMEVFKNNPHIKHLIQHKEETPIDKLSENIENVRKKFHCEKVIDFSESIEVALSQHPRSPNYKLPKAERLARFNRNFYEYAFEHAGLKWKQDFEQGVSYVDLKPELFFEDYEIRDAKRYLKNSYNILLGLSGSGTNKVWPWAQDFAYTLCVEYPDAHIITVGDAKCKLIEPELSGRITNLSGEITMRESMALTSVVDLVISPDTGLLHASGCFDTPKICLLGHTTHEMISKHFENAYPVEADEKLAPCTPCSYLIYNMRIQCPLNPVTQSSVCMADGIPLHSVLESFKEVHSLAQLKEGS